MRNRIQCMLAAILFGSLVMTSCHDADDAIANGEDNPVTPAEPGTSAVDHGTWWIDDSHMDQTVKPGDNFYMHCIGTWWKNTTLTGEGKAEVSFQNDMSENFKKRVAALTDANYQVFKSHLNWADDGSATAIAAQKLYDGVLEQSGLDKAETADEVLHAFGKLVEMGIAPGFRLEPFFYKGKICLYFKTANEFFIELQKDTNPGDDASQSSSQPSLQQMIMQYPELQSHLVPLSGSSATRAIPQQWSAIKGIIEGMGIDTENVFLLEGHAALMPPMPSEQLKKYVDEENENMASWQEPYEKADVKALKKYAMSYVRSDSAFISRGAMEKINAGLDFTLNGKKVETRMSLKKVEEILGGSYLPYLRSKMVADQMVPAGTKETLLKCCEELKAVFAQRIKDSEWLSESSKLNAIEKLNAMKFNVAYPDKWYAEGLPDFSKSQSLLEDLYISRSARIKLLKAIIGKDRNESFTVTAMSEFGNLTYDNATYDPNSNSMNILPFYVLPPFYDAAQSLAINYANLCTIGHEMTHGFDTAGSRIDKNGDYKAEGIWADASDKAEFDRRAELLVKCYESFDLLPDELPGQKANGKFTLAENIADLGGGEIAYQAYLNRLKADGYTGDQLKQMKQRFFQTYAETWRAKYNGKHAMSEAFGDDTEAPNEHSLPKERVNGVVTNMDGWYEAFDVTDGALYRKPAERIKIW